MLSFRRLKAEYALLSLAVLCFAVTLVFRARASRTFILLDDEFQRLNLSISVANEQPANSMGEDSNIDSILTLLDSVKEKTTPYTYFSSSLDKKLTHIFSLTDSFSKNPSDSQKAFLLISEIHDFQNQIHAKQRELSGGYDILLFFPIILAFLAVCTILYKRFVQASELERITLVNKKQRDFSRNLHDTVAQDLAAARVYIENGDIQKSSFFADRALKETRYMIDSLDSPPDKSVTKLIEENMHSFEVNYKIKTELVIASKLIQEIPLSAQIEILYVIQESLSNIARHSDASETFVKIVDVGRSLKITIRDNGKGFDESTLNEKTDRKHHGIKNIRERISLLGGSVQFINDGGCVIAISIENIVH
ncbi:sensor histidine kinase [Treponema zioleckii]|uniref:sensor histidine kinase n=1 Tax=Treponema zioleckii TaxID=331680 RepID=UPI00168AECBA|nr:ATP-binding protein [Treponema zioleckii]